MSVAPAWMALEHLEQVAHLLAFGADWRPWVWRSGAISTYKVGETLAHIFYLEKAPRKAPKKRQHQSPKCTDLSGPPVIIPALDEKAVFVLTETTVWSVYSQFCFAIILKIRL